GEEGDADDGPVGLVLGPYDAAPALDLEVGDADVDLLPQLDPILDDGAEPAAAQVERPAGDLRHPRRLSPESPHEGHPVPHVAPRAADAPGGGEAGGGEPDRRREVLANHVTSREDTRSARGGEPNASAPSGAACRRRGRCRWQR